MSNLAELVKDITYFYIKYYYEKELQNTNNTKLLESELKSMINNYYEKQLTDTNQTKLSEDELKTMITKLYIEKASDLKKYIRDTLKENLGDKYSSFSVENILLEMFADPEFSKHRVYLEIMEYQKNL